MEISRMLYRSRYLLMLLVFVFYTTTVVYFVAHLARLDSSQAVTPMLRSLSNQVFKMNLSLPDVNKPQLLGRLKLFLVRGTDGILAGNSSLDEYIDWNDYEFMAREELRQGVGEQATAFNLTLTDEQQEFSKQLFNYYKFNAMASDIISVERSIGDLRTPVCKTKKYLKRLPEASVSIITIFHNERKSSILRTLHSVVNRSPARLLREIIVVDDASTDLELKEPLENYTRSHFPKVKIIRSQVREGLIRSRMVGANESTGDILVFFDAHVEVNHNYLPPLIEPIVLDYKTIVCPMIDTIKADNYNIHLTVHRERGVFSWDLIHRRLPVFQPDASVPHPVPNMLGAAFAISSKWWRELRGYDPGLLIWGGEQFELTFKSWQCGGRVVDAPCSRVAHLFRPLPYVDQVTKDHLIDKNLLRVARVWMDEYADYVIKRRPVMKTLDPGDLSQQFALKKRLNCKPFKWFLTEVAPDILEFYPPVEPPAKAWGVLKSKHNETQCVRTDKDGYQYLGVCDETTAGYVYKWNQNINRNSNCWANVNKQVFMFDCLPYEEKPTQKFVWDPSTGRVFNLQTRECIDVDNRTTLLTSGQCETAKSSQAFVFEHVNSTSAEEAWLKYKNDLEL